jgi:hypothetical protein
MNISQKMLRNILPDNLMASAGLGNAFAMANIVRRFYCTPMTIANKCPLDCEKCRAKLEAPVEKLRDNRSIVKLPRGVFIYNLRNLVNAAVETQPKVTIRKDKYGIPEENKGTVWDKMLAGL